MSMCDEVCTSRVRIWYDHANGLGGAHGNCVPCRVEASRKRRFYSLADQILLAPDWLLPQLVGDLLGLAALRQ